MHDRHNAPDEFATTRWSVILAAGCRSSSESSRALASLCESYWFPLYAYVRRRVADPEEAQDLTQAFFAELLEKEYVRAATPERGRFRAFLLTAFKHFLSKQWRKARAHKRGAGKSCISLDFQAADARCTLEPASDLTAEDLYNRHWAVTLLDHVMQRLEQECVRSGKREQFERLKGFLVGDHAGVTYAAAARELGITEAAAKMAAHRLRVRYRQLLRDEMAGTVSGPGEVEDEIRQLFATLET